ncbi:hypothetical protein MTR67_048274 [Solanum verrucosum]|uniref:Uncharacterized protein n=1 Tax=Solanum verrucosum TaxID=315347 RepID=A0AAF0ZZW0_SOLVR|nr:hypothetical protein MTR67_048274 [Solanum verrucosum]
MLVVRHSPLQPLPNPPQKMS